jgi:hypothetical protein
VKITLDFEDTEGQWTQEKQEHATHELTKRCRKKGHLGRVHPTFVEPTALALSAPGPVVFHYQAYVEIPDVR